jgi:hypothetical protein
MTMQGGTHTISVFVAQNSCSRKASAQRPTGVIVEATGALLGIVPYPSRSCLRPLLLSERSLSWTPTAIRLLWWLMEDHLTWRP